MPVENNYLKHLDAMRLAALDAKAKAGTLSESEAKERLELIATDIKNQTDLNSACNPAAGGDPGSGKCQTQYANLQAAQASYNNYKGMTGNDVKAELNNIGKITQGLIMYNPNTAPSLASTGADRLTGLPLDVQGRYTVDFSMGDPINGYKTYSPKYFPCATADCVSTGQNLDTSDPGTQAYIKALDAQVFKDINTATTVSTLFSPIGVAGELFAILGPTTSVTAGYLENKFLPSFSKEALQFAAAQYLGKVYGLSERVVNRITATVDLAGGWQAFIDRIQDEFTKGKK